MRHDPDRLDMLCERICSMEFQRSIPSRLRSGSRTSPTRANLVIKDMTPTGDEDAMLVMMQEEGVRRLNHAVHHPRPLQAKNSSDRGSPW
jgi:hypothetical protein